MKIYGKYVKIKYVALEKCEAKQFCILYILYTQKNKESL